MKKFLVIFPLMLLIMLLLTGCGGGPDTPAPAANDSSTPAQTAQQPTTVQGERPIRMAVAGSPNVDPATGSNWVSSYCFINVYDSLVMYNEEGKLTPLLAENWSISEDSLEYVFTLKQGVKFHDGSELKASDVKFSFDRLMTINAGFTYLYRGHVESVEATDDYTVRFTLTQPLGNFIDRLCRLYILNEDLIMANLNMNHGTYSYGEYGDFGRDFLLTGDAGSGPYTVREISQQNFIIADQFKDYHIPFPANAPTYFQLINNTEAATVRAMLASKELELSDNWQTSESYDALAKIPGVTIAQYSNSSTQLIAFNCSLAPTDDIYIRKAVACLLDYNAVVNNIFLNSKPAIGPANANTPGAGTKHSENPYSYNVERAKEYLAQSQYADKLNEISLELFVNSSVASQEKLALMLQAAARQAGLNITVTSAPYATWSERVTSLESTANLSTSSQAPYYYDAGASFEAHFTSTNHGTTTNAAWIFDDKLDSMIFEAMRHVDTAERYAAYAEIEEYILDQCYYLFAADITERVAYHADYVYWPAAEHFAKTGNLSSNELSYHYWFHDFEVYPEKM